MTARTSPQNDAMFYHFDPSVLIHVLLHLQGYYSRMRLEHVASTKSSFNKEPHQRDSTHFNLNTLRLKQNGRRFADDVFKCIFLNENVCILIKISLKFVPKGPINNIPALVQVMAWRRSGDKPLSEPMMVWSPTHLCVTRPQWVN